MQIKITHAALWAQDIDAQIAILLSPPLDW